MKEHHLRGELGGREKKYALSKSVGRKSQVCWKVGIQKNKKYLHETETIGNRTISTNRGGGRIFCHCGAGAAHKHEGTREHGEKKRSSAAHGSQSKRTTFREREGSRAWGDVSPRGERCAVRGEQKRIAREREICAEKEGKKRRLF